MYNIISIFMAIKKDPQQLQLQTDSTKMPYNHPEQRPYGLELLRELRENPKKGRKHANEDRCHSFPLPSAPLFLMGQYTGATFLGIVGVLKLLSLAVAGLEKTHKQRSMI